MVRRTFLQRASFRSGVLTQVCPGPLHPISSEQILSKSRILDDNYKDFRRDSIVSTLGSESELWSITSAIILKTNEHFEKRCFLKSSCMKSRGVRYRPWWSLMFLQVSKHVVVYFTNIVFALYDFSLMFWILKWGKCFAPPLICRMRTPSSW